MTARSASVLAILATSAVGLIASTQTWLVLTLSAGGDPVAVTGTSAMPVLAPLSIAGLALGAAMSIAGLALRYTFGMLAVGIAVVLGFRAWRIVVAHPDDAVTGALSIRTGIAGEGAVSDLVTRIDSTPWPVIVLVAALLMLLAGIWTIGTAHRWTTAGQRYRRDRQADREAGTSNDRAIDSWDDLSRGEDPTS